MAGAKAVPLIWKVSLPLPPLMLTFSRPEMGMVTTFSQGYSSCRAVRMMADGPMSQVGASVAVWSLMLSVSVPPWPWKPKEWYQ
jgi:hypothetical protein